MSLKVCHTNPSGRFVTNYGQEEEAFSKLHHKKIHAFVLAFIKESPLPKDQLNKKNVEHTLITTFPILSDSQTYGRLVNDIVLSILCAML